VTVKTYAKLNVTAKHVYLTYKKGKTGRNITENMYKMMLPRSTIKNKKYSKVLLRAALLFLFWGGGAGKPVVPFLKGVEG